jgi:type I restriction enzyme S subunit
MMSRVANATISEVTTIVTKGTTPTTLGRSFTTHGIGFIKAECITNDGAIIRAKQVFIDHDTDQLLKRSRLQRDDVLFSIAGVIGRTALVRQNALPANTNQAIAILRPDTTRVIPKFLYYTVRSKTFLDHSLGHVVQTAQANVSLGVLSAAPLWLPPLPVQKRIAGILSAYDELIENSQRRIKILEAMARALYREWFVHFRFPGHDSVPRVPSPLGEIPQGWEVKRVPDCVVVNPRVTVPRDGEKPFVPMGCLSNDSMLISNIESRAGNSGAKFQNGDTLFARITPCLENGKTGFVQFLPGVDAVGFGSTEFIVLRSKTLTPEFVYCLARSDEFRGVAIKSMSGATGRQRVQEQCFDDLKIANAPRTILDEFSTIVNPSFRLIYGLQRQIQNLRRTRDLLLPRLLSGQIDVDALDA